jgi:F-type H+-transporting ATPase subunit delta
MNQTILISTAAKRYARAFLEVAIRQRSFSLVLEELETFRSQLLATPMLQQVFLNPALTPEKKKEVLDILGEKMKLQKLTLNFLNTLIRRDRLRLLQEIIVSAEQQFLERQGILVVEVFSAKRLRPEEEQKLTRKLEAFTGKKVQLENRIDANLIGGLITRIGSTLYDGSIEVQLQHLRSKIQEG